MIQENQNQELELDEQIQEEAQEEPIEEEKKPELTPEQKRGILKRQLTKLEKEMGIVEEKPKSVPEKETPKNEFSLKDIRALSSVHDDDVDFVTSWAKVNNIDITDALKNDDVKTVLSGREEKRKTAVATNTGGGKRGTSDVSGDDLLQKVEKGEELSESEMEKAAQARVDQKRQKRK